MTSSDAGQPSKKVLSTDVTTTPRARVYKPKTRLGCKTCKIRRVKCDETKPECQRCQKFGTPCEGYAADSRTSRGKPLSILPRSDQHGLASKVGHGFSGNSRNSSCQMAPMIRAAPSFEDTQEHLSFLHFQQEAVQVITGTYETRLWDYLILQNCRHVPALRQLASAIGALMRSKTLEISNSCSQGSVLKTTAEAHKLLGYSFRQYGRALVGIQSQMIHCENKSNLDKWWTRNALLSALLIYCFECISGCLDSAITHMKNALKLVQTEFATETRRYRHLGLIARPQALEQEVLSAFVRVDQNIMSRQSEEKVENTLNEFSNESTLEPPSGILAINLAHNNLRIPPVFESVIEARKTIEYIQFWALPRIISKFFVGREEKFIEVDMLTKTVCQTILGQLKEFMNAYAPLLSTGGQLKKGSKQHLALLTPHLQAMSFRLATMQIFYRGTSFDNDSLSRDAEEIIEICTLMVTDPKLYRGFVFECEFLPSIFTVSTSSIDISYRVKALNLLKRTLPRQESGWDSVTMVKIAEDSIL